MSKRDYYAVLDLHPECSLLDIKQSFKKLALKWHPDKCYNKAEAQLRFSEINEAYTILGDTRTKQIYDIHGHRGIEIDQENGNQGVFTQENFFFKKGFQGTEKSAFDVLKDIFTDKDDDDFFFNKPEPFGASDNLKARINSFMNDDDHSNHNDIGGSFFESYKPTFMNPEFMMPPAGFDDEIADKGYTAHIFSFFASGNEDQMYTSMSTTINQNGTSTTSTLESFFNERFVDKCENDVNNKEKKVNSSVNTNKIFEELYTPISSQASLIVINDCADDDLDFDDPTTNMKLADKRTSDDIIEELNAKLRDSVSLKSKKISKDKNSLNIRLMNKKPSKKNRS